MKSNFNPFILLILGLIFSITIQAQYNYAEALQKSMFFYECQESGALSDDNRVTWRGNSGMNDGADVGYDLTGGWFDAGDHVKFNFPMAFSATALAWGGIDFADGYTKTGQMQYLKRNLRFVNDYFIKCHTAPNELYGQVGNGGKDHAWWGSAEVMRMERPAYKIDAANPGSELAAETAAAMAAASILFKDDDPAYSQILIDHAKQLYDFADNYRGIYSNSIPDANGYYKSHSGYNDELVWGAIWLYRATNNQAYLDKAESYYNNLSTEGQTSEKSYKWAIAWDDKSYGCYALLAKLTGKDQYKADIERHLDYWTDGYNGSRITYTPGGLAHLDVWGACRYSANTSFLAVYYADEASSTSKTTKYKEFASSQLNYMLGDNPLNRSYVCGFGNNPPVNPHHRTAHGCWSNNHNGPPEETRHILYGALAGGPNDDDSYEDVRSNHINNEVACDYNACYTGVLSYFADQNNNTPLPNFPVIETPTDEYFMEAKFNAQGDTFSEWAFWANNHTAWPARAGDEYKFQIFIDISEGVAAGYSASDYVVSANGGSANYTNLIPWDASKHIYYCEVTFKSSVDIWPGGNSEAKEESQIRIRLPYDADASAWDPTNDWVNQEMDGNLKQIENIPMYVDGAHVFGLTPSEAIPVESISLSSTSETLDIDDSVVLTATVLPDNASNKTVTWTTSNSAIATVSSDGNITAIAPGNATITATSSNPNISATCSVTVNEPPFIEVTDVTLNSASLMLDINETGSLVATVTPSNATDPSISWTSSNESIATVSSAGVVTGIAQGDVEITANTSNPNVKTVCTVSVSDQIITPTYYELSISTTGLGTVTTTPAGSSFEEGTVVSLEAIAEAGYIFDSWSGDISGSTSTTTVTMDADKSVMATFTEITGPCDNPTSISLPYKHDGSGEFCYVTSDEISHVNSWNMESVEINNVDFTNTWSNSMPDKIDGKYYIKIKGNYNWSHFEASMGELKNATYTLDNLKQAKIGAYPNPFVGSTEISIPNTKDIIGIVITDHLGKVVKNIPKGAINSTITVGESLDSGVYLIVIKSKNKKQVIKVVKE